MTDALAAERHIWFREANHRFANQLSIIAGSVNRHLLALEKGGGASVAPEDVRGILRDIAGKIFGMAELHRLLAKDPGAYDVDLGPLLMAGTRTTVAALGLGEKVHVTEHFTDSLRLPTETGSTVLFIVSEIVMNAIKYAHPTGVPVLIRLGGRRSLDNAIVVEIADDGIGLPEGFDPQADGGMGFRLIRSLAGSLNAGLAINSSPLGLSFQLILPVQPATRTVAWRTGSGTATAPRIQCNLQEMAGATGLEPRDLRRDRPTL